VFLEGFLCKGLRQIGKERILKNAAFASREDSKICSQEGKWYLNPGS